MATALASLRRGLRSDAALRSHQIAPLWPPPNPTAAGSSYSGCAPRSCLPSHASSRTISSLAVEHGCSDAPGFDPEATAPDSAGEGGGSRKRGGLSTLRSLFTQTPVSSTPKSTTGEAFAEPRSRMRPMRSAGSGPSGGGYHGGEVSPEMAMLIGRLREDGYLRNACFSQELDSRRVVSNGYARGALVAAAQRFGEDHQEIAKWLSGNSLKKVALSGCPCTERRTVFAAKRLRSFFWIQEDIVCRGCMMKKSCKFVNKNVNREDKLILSGVMRVLIAYAWDYASRDFQLQKELTNSVSKSLKEVISLSA
uniref:Mannose-1-phosphate guanyltransferase beta n=1 Tax=Anthurium amnicola TaxID=1678845 RepID=A0A1D1YP28_9ARAE